MPSKPTPYRDTEVSIERSQAEIRRILHKYGCSHISQGEDLEKGQVLVRFARVIEGTDKTCVVRFCAQVPEVKLPSAGQYRGGKWFTPERLVQEKQEQAQRQAWRALYYAVKSRMETILFGMETFEEAFLAHVEFVGKSGERTTIGEYVLPFVRAGRALTTGTPEAP